MNRRAIVIAWTVTDRVKRNGWQDVRTDLGARGEFDEVTRVAAVVWLNSGDSSDETKARAHADSMGAAVFTYTTGEPDPIGAAKRDMMTKV